jgi:hypothetical protein
VALACHQLGCFASAALLWGLWLLRLTSNQAIKYFGCVVLSDIVVTISLVWPADATDSGLLLNRKLTRLVLTPGSTTPASRRGGTGGTGGLHSPGLYDSAGRQRSPWRLAADCPASQQRGSASKTPLSERQRSPLGRAALGAMTAGGGSGWQALQQQLLQRCQADGGGLRITTAKKRVPALAAAASPAAPAVQLQLPPPTPALELPPYSMASAQPAAKAAPKPAVGKPAAAAPSAQAPPSQAPTSASLSAPAALPAAGGGGSGAGAFTPAFGTASSASAPAAAGERWLLPSRCFCYYCCCCWA